MTARDDRWQQERFIDELDLVVQREDLHDDVKLIVLPWVMSRLDDPYSGVRREPGTEHPDFGNLWFGGIPGTDVRPGCRLACSYWIVERKRLLRCNSYAVIGLLA